MFEECMWLRPERIPITPVQHHAEALEHMDRQATFQVAHPDPIENG
jgi:hypothetical protein